MRYGATIALLFAIGLRSQQSSAPQPTFRSGTEQIRVDAVVLDAQGNPLRGLQRDDFVLLDRGEPRPLTFFSEITRNPGTAPLVVPHVALDVADNSIAHADRLIVVVIDDLHFLKDRTDIVKSLARRIVEEVGPNAALAVVTTSGNFGVEFTNDRRLVLAAIERFEDKFDPFGSKMSLGLRRALNSPNLFAGSRSTLRRGRTEPSDLGAFFSDMQTYKVLEDVAKMLSGQQAQRKALLWISSGLRGNPGQGTRGGASGGYHGMAFNGALDAMRRANVVTYGMSPDDSISPALRQMAEMSGGIALSSRDSARVQNVIADLDHYYLLGFAPPENSSEPREWHSVEIKVNRPGVTVRHRRGYLLSPPPVKSSVNSLMRAGQGLLPSAELPVRVFAAPVARVGREVGVAVAVETNGEVRSETGKSLSAGQCGDITYMIVAVDLKKKRIAKATSRHVSPGNAPVDEPGQPCQIVDAITLSPGRYQLRVSARDEQSSKDGSAYLSLDLEDISRSSLSLGGVILGLAENGSSSPNVLNGGNPRSLFPFRPTLRREFASQSVLRVFAPVFRRGLPTEVEATVEILDAEDRVVFAGRRGGVTTSVDLSIGLSDLDPGVKRIRLHVSSAHVVAQREVGFVIR